MEQLIMALIVTALGAPAMAWATNQSGSRKAFERDKAKFEAGQGRDPSNRFVGPHLSFGKNVRGWAIIMLPVVYAILWITR